MTGERRRREDWAQILGIAVALAAMATASWVVHWPAPGVSVALGFAAYWLARGRTG